LRDRFDSRGTYYIGSHNNSTSVVWQAIITILRFVLPHFEAFLYTMDKRIMDFEFGEKWSSTKLLRAAEARPYFTFLSAMSIIAVLLYLAFREVKPLSQIPLVTQKSFWDISGKKAKEDFMVNCRGVIERGFESVRTWTEHRCNEF
jgi:hypothetical protein